MTDPLKSRMNMSVVMSVVMSLLVACLAFAPVGAQGAGTEKPVDPAQVEIHVEHGVALPGGKPGFRVDVSGWQPNGELFMYAIAPDGTQIELIPKDKPAHAGEDGEFSVDIDYQRKGLGQGHWMFLIAGQPGIHEFETDLPRIDPPTAAQPKWRLIFGKDESKSM